MIARVKPENLMLMFFKLLVTNTSSKLGNLVEFMIVLEIANQSY